MAKMGRPRKEINKEEFEKLCALQCTREEICGWFDISEKTLDAWCKRTYRQSFSLVFAQKRGKGKVSLRRNQFKMAEVNASMAIWLGKQYLGQRDNIDIETGGNITIVNDIPKPEPKPEQEPDDNQAD